MTFNGANIEVKFTALNAALWPLKRFCWPRFPWIKIILPREDDQNKPQFYFLSREKDNIKLEVIGNNPFDPILPINTGILADEMVATSQGVSVRRVIYQDPETRIIYHYLTNLPATIPPGLVALLYKARWDIEKVFDEFKNKLCETKAWASSPTAKTQQARLLCLTHNLMTLMEEQIRQRSGVINQAEFKRKAKTRAAHHAVERLTQRTVKFIRWLKNHFRSNHKGTPTSGNREWGVVTVDRQPKPAYWQMRKLFSPVHSLTVSNGIIRVTPRRADEIPSYTLRGYKLKWDGGEIALPDLKPGDPVWTAGVKVKPGTNVKLFSPTVYDMADSE